MSITQSIRTCPAPTATQQHTPHNQHNKPITCTIVECCAALTSVILYSFTERISLDFVYFRGLKCQLVSLYLGLSAASIGIEVCSGCVSAMRLPFVRKCFAFGIGRGAGMILCVYYLCVCLCVDFVQHHILLCERLRFALRQSLGWHMDRGFSRE